MDLRDAIESYANAVSSRDYYEDRENTQLAASSAEALHQSRQNLDALLDVAEAALAYAKYRADADCGAVDQMSFEHWRLWNRFIESMAKTKATGQQ